MIQDPRSDLQQTIILAHGCPISPMCLEGILHILRTHRRVHVYIQEGDESLVPSACSLAINTLTSAGAEVVVTNGELVRMDEVMKGHLV